MKKEATLGLTVLVLILFTAYMGYVAGVRQSERTISHSQQKIDSLVIYTQKKEFEFNSKLDSFGEINIKLKAANNNIDKSIKTIYIRNEINKKRFFNSNDSSKLFISDSCLRANGYK